MSIVPMSSFQQFFGVFKGEKKPTLLVAHRIQIPRTPIKFQIGLRRKYSKLAQLPFQFQNNLSISILQPFQPLHKEASLLPFSMDQSESRNPSMILVSLSIITPLLGANRNHLGPRVASASQYFPQNLNQNPEVLPEKST